MRTIALASVAALLMVLVPVGGSQSASSTCWAYAESSIIEIDDTLFIKVRASSYLPANEMSVWEESNGAPGLQTGPSYCGVGVPMLPADTKLATISGAITL